MNNESSVTKTTSAIADSKNNRKFKFVIFSVRSIL